MLKYAEESYPFTGTLSRLLWNPLRDRFRRVDSNNATVTAHLQFTVYWSIHRPVSARGATENNNHVHLVPEKANLIRVRPARACYLCYTPWILSRWWSQAVKWESWRPRCSAHGRLATPWPSYTHSRAIPSICSTLWQLAWWVESAYYLVVNVNLKQASSELPACFRRVARALKVSNAQWYLCDESVLKLHKATATITARSGSLLSQNPAGAVAALLYRCVFKSPSSWSIHIPSLLNVPSEQDGLCHNDHARWFGDYSVGAKSTQKQAAAVLVGSSIRLLRHLSNL